MRETTNFPRYETYLVDVNPYIANIIEIVRAVFENVIANIYKQILSFDFRKLNIPSNKTKNDAKQKKKRNRRRHRLLYEVLLDFARNTTLHGLRYVTERGISMAEKIFWIIIFALSLTVCIVLTHNVWVKWQTNPPIVMFSEGLTYVTEVPFPAVTICPQQKINQMLYNYTKAYKDLYHFWQNELIISNKTLKTDKELFLNELAWIRLICQDFTGLTGNIPFLLNRSLDDHTAVQNIIKVAPKLKTFFFLSTWQAEYSRIPLRSYSQVMTEEGVCYTLNSLAAREIFKMNSIQRNYSYLKASTRRRGWSVEGGYSSTSHDTYPRRGRGSGSVPDLRLIFEEIKNRDNLCDGSEPGFKVYLHHPGDLPQSSLYYYTAIPDYVNSFAISVDVLKTSDSLLRCPPRIRQCYLPGEKDLRYFRVYSQNNCRLECITNYTLARCSCVWFHMPQQYISEDGITTGNSSQCHCLPSCASIQYKAEILKTSAKFQQCVGCYVANETYITMYFKEPIFVSKVRECSGMFELTDFLAYCGGLLGLFLGFSFLSVVEIFYFCTLRLCCAFRRDDQVKKETNTDADLEKNT